MFLGNKVRTVRRADKLVAICEAVVQQCGILNISQLYRPPRPVTGIDFYFTNTFSKLYKSTYTVAGRRVLSSAPM
jgi:hypothetical protein